MMPPALSLLCAGREDEYEHRLEHTMLVGPDSETLGYILFPGGQPCVIKLMPIVSFWAAGGGGMFDKKVGTLVAT